LGSGCPPPKSSCIQESRPQMKMLAYNSQSNYLKLIDCIIHKRIKPLVHSSAKNFLEPQAHPQKYALHKPQQLHVMHRNFNKVTENYHCVLG
jgi:hypothetical protein